MTIYEVIERFPDQKACIDHLEAIRFRNGAYCPHCGSMERVRRSNLKSRVGRWNCHDCKSSFNVLSGTPLAGTHIPLPRWFAALAIMVNAKKSVSSHQLARDLGLTQQTAWFMQQRLRAVMASDSAELLKGVIEADETWVGGKPRKDNKRDDMPSKRDRSGGGPGGTTKTPVIGAVERDGSVVAQVAEDLTGKGILEFIRSKVSPAADILVTDENTAYRSVRAILPHSVINHRREYVNGPVHTNTIEGFWSLLKRAWYGSHHQYTRGFMPLFVAEAAWKYNHRDNARPFDAFMDALFA